MYESDFKRVKIIFIMFKSTPSIQSLKTNFDGIKIAFKSRIPPLACSLKDDLDYLA